MSIAAGPSRQRLLDAGVALLASGGVGLLRRSLTATSVSKRAKVAWRTFYDQFETTDEFVDAVLADIAAAAVDQPDISALLEAERGDLCAVLTQLTTNILARARTHHGRGESVAQVLRAMPRRDDSTWSQLVEALADLGHPPRSPYGADQVAAALSALIDGFGARPPADDVLIVPLVLSTLAAMTSPAGDQSPTGAEVLERSVSTTWRERTHEQPVLRVRRLVLDAAAEEIASKGYARLTLAALSGRTGLSESAIRKYVGTPHDVAVGMLAETYPALEIAISRDAASNGDRALRSHVERFVTLCRARPEIGDIELAIRQSQAIGARPRAVPADHRRFDTLLASVLETAAPALSKAQCVERVNVLQQLACTLARDMSSTTAVAVAEMIVSMITRP